MRKLLFIALSISCCLSAQAGMWMQIQWPTVDLPSFAKDRQPIEPDEYVPLSEQSFPILRQRMPRVKPWQVSPSPREHQLDQLIQEQERLNNSIERQRRIFEQIRQQKLLEATQDQSP